MYKKKAVMITVIIAALAVLVLVAVSTVFLDDSKERYQNVPAPEEIQNQDDSAAAPAAVDPQATTPPAQSETEPETVVEETAEPVASLEQSPATPDQAEETKPAGEAQIHIVTAQGLVYNPLVIVIQPGDTVAWENMPTHDTQSMEGLIPEGAEAWHSAMGENYQRTFTQEGIYVYKCTPHFGAGMGGVIIVGKPVNLEAIKAADAKGAAGRLVRKAIQAAESL